MKALLAERRGSEFAQSGRGEQIAAQITARSREIRVQRTVLESVVVVREVENQSLQIVGEKGLDLETSRCGEADEDGCGEVEEVLHYDLDLIAVEFDELRRRDHDYVRVLSGQVGVQRRLRRWQVEAPAELQRSLSVVHVVCESDVDGIAHSDGRLRNREVKSGIIEDLRQAYDERVNIENGFVEDDRVENDLIGYGDGCVRREVNGYHLARSPRWWKDIRIVIRLQIKREWIREITRE